MKRALETYVKCLRGNVEALALASDEPAETIVKAVFGSCIDLRIAAAGTGEHGVTRAALEEIDRLAGPDLTLKVIVARTKARQPAVPPTPPAAPAPRETPL